MDGAPVGARSNIPNSSSIASQISPLFYVNLFAWCWALPNQDWFTQLFGIWNFILIVLHFHLSMGKSSYGFWNRLHGVFIYDVWKYTIHWGLYLFLVDLCGRLSVSHMIQELRGVLLFLLWGGNFVIQLSYSFEVLCFSVFLGMFFLACPSSLRSQAFYSYGCRHHICFY